MDASPLMQYAVTYGAPLAFGLLFLLLTLVLGWLIALLAAKAKESKAAGFFGYAATLAREAVQHVETNLKPKLLAATADGKLTPDELRQLRDEAIKLVKEWGGTTLQKEARKWIGGDFSAWLVGLVESAVAMMAGKSATQAAVVINAHPDSTPDSIAAAVQAAQKAVPLPLPR